MEYVRSPCYEHEVYNALLKNDDVDDVFPLFGEWDIICRVEGEDFKEIDDKVTKIREIKGVLSTKTLFGF